MDETRPALGRYGWSWRRVAVVLGALGWWVALVGQVLGNGLGALAAPGHGLRDGDEDSDSLLGCVQASVRAGQVEAVCARSASALAMAALLPGLLSIWWNPCLSPKLRGVRGRMVGLKEFYKLQILLNALRVAAWYYLDSNEESRHELATVKAMQATMLILNLAVSFGLLDVKILSNADLYSALHDLLSDRLCRLYPKSDLPGQSRTTPITRAEKRSLEYKRQHSDTHSLKHKTSRHSTTIKHPPLPDHQHGNPFSHHYTPLPIPHTSTRRRQRH